MFRISNNCPNRRLSSKGSNTQTGKLLQPWYDKAEDAFCTECEYNVHTSIHILEQPVMGCYCLLPDVCRLGTEKHLSSTDHRWNEVTTDWQHNTAAHRHNTGGFGTPMLVLLLCIFDKTHSCRTLPPLWGVQVVHRPGDQRSQSKHSTNQQLQAVFKVGILWGAGGQEGCGHRSPCGCGDIKKSVSSDAAGCWIAECCGCRDAGQVDAKSESCLLQGLLWHSKSLELLLTVSHVGVLATSTDAI